MRKSESLLRYVEYDDDHDFLIFFNDDDADNDFGSW